MIQCDSAWQTEALEEGRLQGSALRRAARHLESCAACRDHAARSQQIREELVALGGDAVSELALKRGRQQLLARANKQSLEQPSSARKRVLLAAFAAALLALAAGFVLKSRRAAEVDAVQIVALEGSVYQRRTVSNREIISLESGELQVRVQHQRGQAGAGSQGAVLLKTPDLEIEDQGTVFTVRVADQQTTLVSVQEGRVAIRGTGPRVILLEAGEHWAPAPPSNAAAAQSAVARSSAPASPATSAAPKTRPFPTAQQTDGVATDAGPAPATSPESAAFEAAMQAFRSSKWSLAASRFAAFQAQFAGSARSEDASYLRVIALQRGGQRAQMAAAARGYLRSYPNGFRAKEIKSLSEAD